MPAAPSILFVGDVVGGLGRRTLLGAAARAARAATRPTFVVVNGENVAGGLGHHAQAAPTSCSPPGVDAITLGNHTYRRREIWPYLDAGEPIVRPANYLRTPAGPRALRRRARRRARSASSTSAATCYLRAGRVAFLEIDAVLAELAGKVDHVLVDMHAEATSEKVAMGWYLDGRVTAVVGTHTHVPTADARVLPGGTAYITDVGMTGPRGGVIGVKKEQAIAVAAHAHERALRDQRRGPVARWACVIRARSSRCARRRSSKCSSRGGQRQHAAGRS